MTDPERRGVTGWEHTHTPQCNIIGGGPGHDRCICYCHHTLGVTVTVTKDQLVEVLMANDDEDLTGWRWSDAIFDDLRRLPHDATEPAGLLDVERLAHDIRSLRSTAVGALIVDDEAPDAAFREGQAYAYDEVLARLKDAARLSPGAPAEGVVHRRLAERFGVSPSTVSLIVSHQTWRHV